MPTHFPDMGKSPGPTSSPASPPSPPLAGSQIAHLIRQPGDPIVHQRFEFKALSLKVREHLVNQIGLATRDDAARLLWVQGRPGEGKSEGCLVASLKAGFHVAVLSPGLFAGEVEGASVQALHATMGALASWSAAQRCRVVVIIDDFDLSIANAKEDQGTTINTPLLINEFMSLADKHDLYRNVDGSNIGFILTVNDATGMRESLTRPGRSDLYDHKPSREDKANIAWAVLDPKTSAERDLVHALVRKYAARQPVGFWKALYFQMRAMHLRRITDSGMPDRATIDRAQATRLPLTPEIAWAAAKQVRQRRVRNYLARARWWRT